MNLAWIFSGGLAAALVSLGVLYWRSHLAAQDTQSALQHDLETLKQTSQQIQRDLEKQLQETSETLQTRQREKANLEDQVEALKQQCLRLRSSLEQQTTQVQQDTQVAAFQQVQMLLTQYPSVRRMVEGKPDLPARNLVAMFTPLDNLVQFWGCQAIGTPWELAAYDPQLHQADSSDLQPGEPIYIRFVGYRQGDRILIPAKVSRTLPAGATA
ncbi:molecular chaperone GrpE [Trichocoleus sp. FACHB-591]|uniref:molecular chaperone GrpE n=1 Tax=Trichocoleus sp. FACHB-591 TaxID=2692872 RepID=UPI00168A09F5|nr:molecular chaperone GrpE [Trichocoleus sp. FACHB-591]MBD2096384.1 molecular chaperone GrpE [Trichocoleus sp. FACHB-591]